jgi:membrane-associated protein
MADVLELAVRIHHHFHGPPVDYVGLGAAAAIGWIGVPGAGEAILITAGIVASKGKLDIAEVVAVATLGAFVGGITGWIIGLKGGRTLVTAPGPFLPARERALDRGNGFYERFGPVAVFFTPSWMAGIVAMRWTRFLPANAIAALVWALVIGVGAFLVGPSITELAEDLGLVGLLIVGGLVVAAVIGEVLRRRRRNRRRTAAAAKKAPVA